MSPVAFLLVIGWVVAAAVILFSREVAEAAERVYTQGGKLSRAYLMLLVAPIVLPALGYHAMFDPDDADKEEARYLLGEWWRLVTFREVPPR